MAKQNDVQVSRQAASDEKKLWTDRLTVLQQMSFTGALDYGKMLLRTAVVVNAGALVVVPAYIGLAAGAGNPVPIDRLYGAGAWLAGGLACAVFACYAAYVNLMILEAIYEDQHAMQIGYIEAWGAKDRDKTRAKALNLLAKKDRVATWWMAAANLLGLLSYTAFVIGCYTAAQVLLTLTP